MHGADHARYDGSWMDAIGADASHQGEQPDQRPDHQRKQAECGRRIRHAGCQAQYRLERVERACPNVAKDNAQGRKAERGQATRDCRPSCGADGVGHAGWSSHSALGRIRHAPRSTGRQRPRRSEAMFCRIVRASPGFDPTRRLNGAISNGAFGARADEKPDRLPCVRLPTLGSQDFRRIPLPQGSIGHAPRKI